MKFLVDVCVSHRVVEFLEHSGHDVALVQERDERMDDADILGWADAERRVLVTGDKDFGHHIFALGRHHAGLIRLPNAHGRVLVDLMAQALTRHSEDLTEGAIVTATIKRMRVRRRTDH